MPEFLFFGRLTLENVSFEIVAVDEAEALIKAGYGQWDDYDLSGGSAVDCKIDPKTIERKL